MKITTLRLILGDQLNHKHSWFDSVDNSILYVMMEIRQETDYVTHHIQKVVGFFMAMRQFSQELHEQGHRINYIMLDDEINTQSLTNNLLWLIQELDIQLFEYQLPDEYRLDHQLQLFCQSIHIPSKAVDSEHFLSKRDDLASFFKGKKTYLMESFYRMMRKKYNILMDEGQPISGQWNYDADNRKKLPKEHQPIQPLVFEKNVEHIVGLIHRFAIPTIGNIQVNHFSWPVSRTESLALLDYFIQHCLAYFGTYEDAMHPAYWSIYHSRLSFSLNLKLLHPLEVIQKSVHYWEQNQNTISIAQIEGFIRQILGWREYMRGIYWAKMPEFASMNFFGHNRKLPSWFWTGQTKMACLRHSIGQSLEYAYAHHIQRLMLTGNFMLLTGIHPDEVDTWYLGIYIDAIQWVEITNTRGMSQYADGGIVGSKPYVASANYIDKMSHYCGTCFYDKNKKTGDKACPFNSFYWHFFDRNRALLEKNPRIGMAYMSLHKMSDSTKQELLKQADFYLENIETL
ncbi:cryptochrome/photolyase family protein [Flectobacillus major]|uniref:cryptochrome/photolyase family protein n=1 Tax=Flectobacillus major TaxID=103 RepID=UPI000422ABC7|nr:cryptochrome/photolyase family protein [Flectobacillus major]